jgi:Domain of unknown function (DUF4384)
MSLALAAAPMLCTSLGAQEAGARDMFFGGLEATAPAAAAARRAQPAPARTAATNQGHGSAAVKKDRGRGATGVLATDQGKNSDPKLPIINAARVPLGLRYSILKMTGADTTVVPLSTIFHSGERIQLCVEANTGGFLYIVGQGSSGAWSVMFPTKSLNGGSNRVEAGKEHTTMFRFDSKPGVERLFVVLSRVPERDLDSVIYSLKGNSAPAAGEPMMLASNLTVGDPLVAKLRTSYTRDMVLEEVATPGTVEQAMYVVNKSTGPDARVVADIKLIHE